uniref:TRAP transporter substrate-binding protein n=1 Tax=candidate division WOR-3 bacterium TaxID=2052148 RepID=A0A7V3ZWW7_UNCW3
MREMIRKVVSKMGIVGLIFTSYIMSVYAQEKIIELTYASPYAPTHPFSLADQKWFEKIEKETGGRVKIKPYWAGTLISSRESMTEVAKGAADIAFITPIYEKAGVDITKAILDFFRGTPPEINMKIYWEIFYKFPELRKEYEKVKILGINAAYPMFLMTTKKPVKNIDDLKGMRIRITGDVMARTMKALGAEVVSMPAAEVYEALSKGIIEGVFFANADFKALRLAEVIKYATVNFLQDRGVYASRAMNLNSWAKLPPEIQKIFEANIEFWSVETYKQLLYQEEEGKELAIRNGVQFIKMDESSLEKYAKTFEEEVLKEAKALDEKGLPGTKIYNEIKKLQKEFIGKTKF